MERRVDQAGDHVLLLRVVLPRVRPRREQLLDPRQERQALLRQGLPDLLEGRLEVLGEGRPAEEREHVAAEVERRQLGQAEALHQPLLVALDQPPDLLAVDPVVVQREPGLLEGLDVTPDRALGDAVRLGELQRARVATGLDRLQDLPLPDDLGVPHAGSSGRRVGF